MFCKNCGKEMGDADKFCNACGANTFGGSSADKISGKNAKYVIKGGALLLCVLFFMLPLVQCSQYTDLNVTGWEIATGTGEILDREDAKPLVFVLIIMPIVLLIMAFANKSFRALRNVSTGGAAIKIIFIMATYILLHTDDYEGYFSLTGFNWLVLAIYIGLCVFAHNCIKYDDADWYVAVAQRAGQQNQSAPSTKECGSCQSLYNATLNSCPKCGHSSRGFTKSNSTTSATKECKSCQSQYDTSLSSCPKCGNRP